MTYVTCVTSVTCVTGCFEREVAQAHRYVCQACNVCNVYHVCVGCVAQESVIFYDAVSDFLKRLPREKRMSTAMGGETPAPPPPPQWEVPRATEAYEKVTQHDPYSEVHKLIAEFIKDVTVAKLFKPASTA